ncbi:Xaa-Pro dipeptidyl-peptidase [Lacinutrix sp. Hel_I_90]|uniref:Xaa-Pro dipeptidyl-peptidase n=1 Tax=Lacinutrix sp. Hel_I_90 TaxID=1249999 RepID=UPI0005CA1EDD|nr:Xaa-Pro dipeptidyl-peptidase [Lacinutrix sp. Hel_I_90]
MILAKKISRILFLYLCLGTFYFTQGQTVPVFENGEAQIVEGFSNPKDWITHDLWVETTFNTDGDDQMDRMHVSVTRPLQTETEALQLPVVYESSPYYAGVAPDVPNIMWNVEHELGEATTVARAHPEVTRTGKRPVISNSLVKEWVPRGYIVIHSSSPGTGLSQGSPTVGGPNESLAPKAVVDWLNGRAKGFTTPDGDESVYATWTTGKVGMTGTSYNGTLPIAAATTGVQGLEAIIPIAPNTSYYHYYRSNGLVRSPGGYLGEDIDVLYDFIHSGDESKREYSNRVVRDNEMRYGMDRLTGDYNDFWAGRDYLNQMENMTAALLMSHGFNDWNVMPEHSNRIYQQAKKQGLPTQIYYHQDGHGGPPPMRMMNRWFTRYLHGVQNGVENDKQAWIVRENDARDNPTPYGAYPNPLAQPVTLYLNKGGNEVGELTRKNKSRQRTETLTDNYAISGEAHAKAKKSKNRLLYTTPILEKDLHLSGETEITISVSSNKPAVNLSVWMVSLPWESDSKLITDNIITRGWADPQNNESLSESSPLVPGEFYKLSFKLQPDDQIIRAGQQIGLVIFASDKEFTLHPKPGTELTVDLDETSITIPVVGGEDAFKKSI